MDDLKVILEAIQDQAKENGFLTISKFPILNEVPEVIWTGDWEDYLLVTRKAKPTVVYISADQFDIDEEKVQWLSQRISERTKEWEQYNQKLGHLACVWFTDGVAHQLSMDTPWYVAYSAAVDEALEEAEEVEEDNRLVRKQEEAVTLFQLARHLARHDRFPEATSHEKRMFMAEQLFKDNRRTDQQRIVQLAEMIYWWEVEPSERVLKAQKAQELRASGESIKNIQVLLKMSESQVRAALQTRDE